MITKADLAGKLPPLGMGVSLLIHILLFLGGTAFLWRAPTYEVTSGTSASEVELVAAAPAEFSLGNMTVASPLPQPVTPNPPTPPTPANPDFPAPDPAAKAPASEPSHTKPRQASTATSGVQFPKQARAFSGTVTATPNYMENAPPDYPELSQERHETGTVLLLVDVSVEGFVHHVEISRSSGYHLLDSAALAAVRGWKFCPGKIADLPVASQVLIPVKFQLR